jgi:hypothetical protein
MFVLCLGSREWALDLIHQCNFPVYFIYSAADLTENNRETYSTILLICTETMGISTVNKEAYAVRFLDANEIRIHSSFGRIRISAKGLLKSHHPSVCKHETI